VILAVDVQYSGNAAFVAGVLFDNWNAIRPMAEYLSSAKDIVDYKPGIFYKRELP
jgi:deoxyinosine 3'endonuclease (endonuclease V)